jgi:hypothetical protein
VKYPEPALGSAQLKILRDLKDANGNYIETGDERAVEKLWKKGYVRWQAGANPKVRMWSITKAGLEALERREP